MGSRCVEGAHIDLEHCLRTRLIRCVLQNTLNIGNIEQDLYSRSRYIIQPYQTHVARVYLILCMIVVILLVAILVLNTQGRGHGGGRGRRHTGGARVW